MHSEGQPTSETRLFSRPIVLVTVAGLVAIAAAAVVVGIASGGRSGSSVEPSDSAAFFLRGSGRRYLALTPLGRGKTRILKLPRALGNVDLDEVSMAFSPDGSTLSFLAGGTFFVVETRSLRMKRLVSKRELGRGADAASLSPMAAMSRLCTHSSNGIRAAARAHGSRSSQTTARADAWRRFRRPLDQPRIEPF